MPEIPQLYRERATCFIGCNGDQGIGLQGISQGDSMNRTLIGAFDVINTLAALVIICGATAYGLFGRSTGSPDILLGIAGLGAGVVGAAVLCGFFALLVEVEGHLRRLVILREAELAQSEQAFGRTAPTPEARPA